MTETANLALSLLESNQAQKHVTVNEGFARLDGLAHLVIEEDGVTVPPVAPDEGTMWSVPPGAVNTWAGQAGRLALFSNGGWLFATPKEGWQAWRKDLGVRVVFDGTQWLVPASANSTSGTQTRLEVIEVDHILGAGSISLTAALIPENASVVGVTTRVLQPIAGTLTSWRLGVQGSDDRYGSGLGTALYSWGRGLTGSPLTYYSATPLQLTATGGDFASGTVRLAVHCMTLGLPSIA